MMHVAVVHVYAGPLRFLFVVGGCSLRERFERRSLVMLQHVLDRIVGWFGLVVGIEGQRRAIPRTKQRDHAGPL